LLKTPIKNVEKHFKEEKRNEKTCDKFQKELKKYTIMV